jgi:hypothetical protein
MAFSRTPFPSELTPHGNFRRRGLLIGAPAAAASGVAKWIIDRAAPPPQPRHFAAILGDITDPLPPSGLLTLRTEAETLRSTLAKGDTIGIYTIQGSLTEPLHPLLIAERPQSGAETGILADNPTMRQRTYENFQTTLSGAITTIGKVDHGAPLSPILEALFQLAHAESFRRAEQRSVVLISDLLQQSPAANFFDKSRKPDFAALRGSSLLSGLEALRGALVTVYHLHSLNAGSQHPEVVAFWNAYFSFVGAEIDGGFRTVA